MAHRCNAALFGPICPGRSSHALGEQSHNPTYETLIVQLFSLRPVPLDLSVRLTPAMPRSSLSPSPVTSCNQPARRAKSMSSTRRVL